MLEHLPQASLEHFIEERVDTAVGAVFASPKGKALRKKAIRYSRMLLDESSELQRRLFFEYEDTENQANLLYFKECYRLGVQDAARLLKGAQEALGEKALEKKEDVRMDEKVPKKEEILVFNALGDAMEYFLRKRFPGVNFRSFKDFCAEEEVKENMSKSLQLVKTGDFEGIKFDCYQDSGKEFWGTREQIGTMLGYADAADSIKKIHQRNLARLDKFSTRVNLSRVEGDREVTREVTVYNFKGLLEICRYSNQPKADAVMDFLWEMADEVRKTGSYSVKGKDKGRGNPDDAQRLELARRRLEIQQRNTDARMAKIMQRMVESPAYALTQESKQILAHEITHLATGREHAAMLPDAGTRFYTAKQVGDDAGVSNRRVMKTAREMGLVAPEGSANEYGRWKMSKSAHGPHECAQWVFSEEGRRRVLEAIADAA